MEQTPPKTLELPKVGKSLEDVLKKREPGEKIKFPNTDTCSVSPETQALWDKANEVYRSKESQS